MRSSAIRAAIAMGGCLAVATPLHAQGYHVRVDTWFRSIAYRGWVQDSVLASATTTGANSGPVYNGYAVTCLPGDTYCSYFRSGESQRAAPLMSTVDGSLFGFGIEGLKIHTRARIGTDFATGTLWPGATPAVQLLEGYAEYSQPLYTVQVGRTHVPSRLAFTGVDGAQLSVRPLGGKLQFTGYGGWGLARGAPLPITSDELSPIDDSYLPQHRQIVYGATAGVRSPTFEGRAIYQRESGRDSAKAHSERGAFDVAWRPAPGFSVSGGAEYDFVATQWGTHDLALRYQAPTSLFGVTLAWRRYRPYFDVWTIWGAFSPVAYNAYSAAAGVAPIRGLDLRGRTEYYKYENTSTETPLVSVRDDGWRWNADVTYSGFRDFTLMWNYHVEKGVGASSVGYGGRVIYQAMSRLTATAYGGYMLRPLELRFDDSKLLSFGLRLDGQVTPDTHANVEIVRYDETRRRPDAAQFDWNQWSVNAGLTLTFSSGFRTPGLNPAILRIPERRSR